MEADDGAVRTGSGRSSRRQFLIGGAVAGVGAAAAISADHLLRPPTPEAATSEHGEVTVPFYGQHQAGIATPAQAHVTFLGLDLRDSVDSEALHRMMRVLSDDAARLTQGRPALADSEPELAMLPARLTVTFGFGPTMLAHSSVDAPPWLGPLPPFATDRLLPEYSDGDLVIQVAAEDPLTVAHTVRVLSKGARSFTTTRWVQHGFRRAHGTERPGTTMRNLFGQVDGTTNPEPGSEEFDRVVWIDDGPLAGGTGMVIRRIAMDLEGWDRLGRSGREQSVGRNLSNGAPLTGTAEFDEPDFDATTAVGFPVIPEFSHMRRARSDNDREVIFRRSYNYDHAPSGGLISDSGMVFVSFQSDVGSQFVPIQQRLDDLDLLNEWTTPIGSSVCLIPPGCAPGEYIGQGVLT